MSPVEAVKKMCFFTTWVDGGTKWKGVMLSRREFTWLSNVSAKGLKEHGVLLKGAAVRGWIEYSLHDKEQRPYLICVPPVSLLWKRGAFR